MKKLLSLIFISFLISFSFNIHGQVESTDSTLHLIEKNDGTKYIAIILSDDARELLIETKTIGKIYILKSEVKRITLIENKDQIKNGEFLEESPFSTRHAFTNNALPVKKGNHYAMANWYGPEVHFAVTDKLSVGAMTTWIGSPFVLVGKYSFPTANPKVNFSIGTMLGSSGWLGSFQGFGGLHWATFTYGDRKKNISFSAGYGYVYPGSQRSVPVPGVYVGDSSVNTWTDINGNTTTETYYYYPEIPYEEDDTRFFKLPIFSVGGIYQITSKTSLFFDSMFGYVSPSMLNRETSSGGITSPIIIEVLPKSKTNALYFMPGLRYQRKEHIAFQIALAGVSAWGESDSVTFPLPMISWFFKM